LKNDHSHRVSASDSKRPTKSVFDTRFLSRRQKSNIQKIGDSALIAACFVFAGVLRGDDLSMLADLWTGPVLLFTIAATLYTFDKLALYKAVLRYVTGAIMRATMSGVAIGAITMFGLSILLPVQLPLGLILIHAMMVLLAVSGARFCIRALIRKPSLRDTTPVVIYGAGHAGQQLVSALNLGLEYQPVAFIDDDVHLHGTTINGVPVHTAKDLRTIISRWGIREILLAMPSLNRQRRSVIIAQLETFGVEVKTIPSMGDLVSGNARFTDLRAVTPEDLLGRDPVPPKPDLMTQNITGKVVMVTGAGGTIGSELCRIIIAQKPAALVMLDVSEYALYAITTELHDDERTNSIRILSVMGSVQNPGRMREILKQFHVQTVFHAAAYKHVLLVEENLIEGIYNNVFGTKVIAEAAVECGVENFTLISTDKTVRPTSVMGATKRLAELICQGLAQKQKKCTFSMVRFGNVLGSSGSVIPRFRDQIERGGPVTVTDPQVTRYFMTISEAAELVIQAGAMARGGDVFVLDMGQPVKILDLAKSMIKLHGLVPYMLDENSTAKNKVGDILIQITGLGHGEKLHEELLIAGNPQVTQHPRILTASETFMAPLALEMLLQELWESCKMFDLSTVQKLLLSAPIDYRPDDREIRDMMWQKPSEQVSKPRLRLVPSK
jgi:FlaA1/EpsC-like NDP-sugar epimerase